MDSRYVRYQNRFKVKNPNRAAHLKEFQFKKGMSGNPQSRLSQIRKKIDAGEELTPEERGLANLRPAPNWEKGQSGNPEGRPVGSVSLVARLKAHLRRHPEDIEKIIEALVKQGKEGNIVATKEMLDRVDGRVAETHRIEGELPIRIQFIPAQTLIDNKGQEGQDMMEGEVIEIKELKEG